MREETIEIEHRWFSSSFGETFFKSVACTVPAAVSDLRAVLQALRVDGPLSRHALAHTVEIAPGTVDSALMELTERGLVREAATHRSTGGRPLKRWALLADARITLGVAFTDSALTLLAVDFAGEVVSTEHLPTPQPPSPVPMVRALSMAVERTWQRLSVPSVRRLGVGIALPGVYAQGRGVLFLPNLPGWIGSDPRGMLGSVLGLPVAIDNDANAAAYAERLRGSAHGVGNYLYCLVGDGTGGALVVEGRTVRGAIGAAGELGHLRVDGNHLCNCGLVGCLETEASGLALRRMRAEGMSLEDALQHMARHLGEALANVVNAVAPEAVVLGGWLVEQHPELVFAVADSARTHTLPILATHVRWIPATIGAEAPAFGAALMLMEAAGPSVLKGGENDSVSHRP